MTASRDPDRLIHSFFNEGLDELPDPVYDAVRDRIETTRQRAGIGSWRTSDMIRYLKIGLAAAAAVAIVTIGFQFLGDSNTGSPGASETPQPTATLEPTPSPPATADAGLPQGPFDLSRPRPGSDVIPMTVTIPASGWVQLVDFNFLKKGNGVDLAEALVMPMAYPAGTGFYVPGDPCQSTSTRPDTPVTTVDDLVAALAAQASRDASEPVDVMVGGYAGKSVTLHVPDDAPFDGAMFDGCENGFFISYDTEQSGYLWHHRPGQIDDLWIVDVDGVIVVIDAEYGPDTPAELVEEMRTLAQSVTFGTP